MAKKMAGMYYVCIHIFSGCIHRDWNILHSSWTGTKLPGNAAKQKGDKQFLIPLLAACVIAVWQLVLSIKTNALTGLIAGVFLLTFSGYFSKWYLPGNYLMKLRVEEFLENGIKAEYIICSLLLALAAGIGLGKFLSEIWIICR